MMFAACCGALSAGAASAGCTGDSQPAVSETGLGAGPSWDEFLANPPMTWEQYRASADRESSPPYRFIVDGDIVLSDEPKLRQYYQTWLKQEYDRVAAHGSALTVRNVLGADVLWSVTDRFNLTYCISNNFGASKAAVVTAMDAATRSWSDRVGVQFAYRPGEDATCTASNTNVIFNVGPVIASYFAASFFPDDVRANRQLLITNDAMTTTAGGRDFQGILRHETGHILGFRHEHIWISCTIEGTGDARQITSYDVDSVMHYPQCRPSGNGGYRQTALDYAGAITLYGGAAQLRGGMIVSDTNASLAMNAYGGAVHGAFLRLVNNCSKSNPDCTWTYRDGMILSDRDPGLAVNAYGGAYVGTDLRLVNNCTKSNTDCTWTYRNGMFVSDSNPNLAINAYGGAASGTGLKLNTCSQGNSDCTFTYLHTMLLSNTNSSLAMNAYGGAVHGAPLKLVDNCSAGNSDCSWILTKGMVLSTTNSNLAMNAYGGAAHLTELKLVNNCNAGNTDCTWTIHGGLLLSDTRLDLAMNAYGGARHGAVLTLVDNCSTSNSDCTWTQAQHP